MKKKPKAFLVPQIITPKILPGQQCTFTVHTDDHHEFNPTYAADYERLAREGKPAPTRCAYVEPTDEERRANTRRTMLDHCRDRVISNAESAVNTMEHFLRTAKQRIAEVRADPEARDFTHEFRFLQLPESMLHEMAWGFANASGSIGNAIGAALEFHRLEKDQP